MNIDAALTDRFVERAGARGLVDVAVTSMDSPIGTLLLMATPKGLVRIAFEDENRDDVLGEVAEQLSPRILEAPRECAIGLRVEERAVLAIQRRPAHERKRERYRASGAVQPLRDGVGGEQQLLDGRSHLHVRRIFIVLNPPGSLRELVGTAAVTEHVEPAGSDHRGDAAADGGHEPGRPGITIAPEQVFDDAAGAKIDDARKSTIADELFDRPFPAPGGVTDHRREAGFIEHA